jgi:hypothetical protein
MNMFLILSSRILTLKSTTTNYAKVLEAQQRPFLQNCVILAEFNAISHVVGAVCTVVPKSILRRVA